MTRYALPLGVLLMLACFVGAALAVTVGTALPSSGELRYVGRFPSGFYTLDVDHRLSLRLTPVARDLLANTFVEWSPDGRFSAAQQVSSSQQLVINTATGDFEWLGPVNPLWFDDATALYFHAQPDITSPSRIYLANPDGTDWRALTPESGVNYFDPDAAPGNDVITFVGSDDNLYSVRSDGSQFTLLMEGGKPLYFPRWSPDGRQVSVVQYNDTGGSNIYLLDADGTNARLWVTLTAFVYAAEWSPSGDYLLTFSGNGEYRLQVNVINRQTSEIASLMRSLDTFSAAPRWSPDGRYVYVVGYRASEVGSRRTFIATAENAATETRAIADSFVAWSPDSARVAYIRNIDTLTQEICVRAVESDSDEWCVPVVSGAESLGWLP